MLFGALFIALVVCNPGQAFRQPSIFDNQVCFLNEVAPKGQLPIHHYHYLVSIADELDLSHDQEDAIGSNDKLTISSLEFFEDDFYDEDDEDNEDDEDEGDWSHESEDDFENSDAAPEKMKKLLYVPEATLTCGKSPFTSEAVVAAIEAGLKIIHEQLPDWDNEPREQPHYYNNHEGFDFPECRDGRMYEFPILVGGAVHQGGPTGRRSPPGAHRVIFMANEYGGVFCGLITHEGASSRRSFVACS